MPRVTANLAESHNTPGMLIGSVLPTQWILAAKPPVLFSSNKDGGGCERSRTSPDFAEYPSVQSTAFSE